jgi:hypothetical protein
MNKVDLLDKCELIRQELKSGETVENTCSKYGISLLELFNMMQYYHNPSPRKSEKPDSWLYIFERKGKFILRKCNVHYGTYRTLSDAVKVRDYFMFNRWDKRNIDKVCSLVGVERVK